MEKTSLALRLARIALEIGSQIDSKCHKKLARKGHENRFRKPREWERKTMRMGMLRDENGSYNIVVFLTICISYGNYSAIAPL